MYSQAKNQRGRLVAPIHVKFDITEGHVGPHGVQNFTPIGARGGNAAPKWQKFPLFGKESPRRGEPFDRFLQSLGAFMRPTTLRFKLDVIRFTGYGVIAEKLGVGHLPKNFPCALQEKLCVGSKNDSHLLEWS